MKFKLVGIQPQKYTLDSGYSFDGVVLHMEDLETKADGQQGNQVTKIKVSAESPFAAVPLALGAEYKAYFDQKGHLDYFAKDDLKGK